MNIIQAIILAVIEGITEFLPISSTGHMIIASSFMKIASEDFTKMFTVGIQFGAILSVLVLYSKRFLTARSLYYKLIIAFIPAAVLGKLLNDYIDALLENPITVAISLLLGGIVLLFIDRIFKDESTHHQLEPSNKSAFIIGLFQCIAMIPGVSRSAATIIGGMQQKLSRKAAAEFSFFLAVPTMLAATGYKFLKYIKGGGSFGSHEIMLFGIGNVVAFIVALIAIKTFITFLQKNGFKAFGYYRIIVGILLLIIHFFVMPLTIS
jgi:undecaprenyl-diphosphatase